MELYQGIVESVLARESKVSKVRKKNVFPTSIVGGPRDMRCRYLCFWSNDLEKLIIL